jgi:hypothetical protein
MAGHRALSSGNRAGRLKRFSQESRDRFMLTCQTKIEADRVLAVAEVQEVPAKEFRQPSLDRARKGGDIHWMKSRAAT